MEKSPEEERMRRQQRLRTGMVLVKGGLDRFTSAWVAPVTMREESRWVAKEGATPRVTHRRCPRCGERENAPRDPLITKGFDPPGVTSQRWTTRDFAVLWRGETPPQTPPPPPPPPAPPPHRPAGR